MDTVKSIRKNKNGAYSVKTKKGTVTADKVILATPPWVSEKLVKLPKLSEKINAHMWHIKGTAREEYDDAKEEMFSSESELVVISRQEDGTYLVYAQNKDLDLAKYFSDCKIIYDKDWAPAFLNGTGKHMVEFDRGDGLYVIGDLMFPSMEDCFVTGIYAANQVLSH